MAWCTAWTSAEISPKLPPLPKILDPELEKVAFTHSGLSYTANYQRLEWLGDAYIEVLASGFIHETFTDVGKRYSQLREIIVRNITLADYFRQYNLPERARLPPDIRDSKVLGRGRSSDHDLMKTQSDMFEAYVAAVILSDPQNGLQAVTVWLKALWGRTLREQIIEAERSKGVVPKAGAGPTVVQQGNTTSSIPHKEKLMQAIGGKGVRVHYRDMPGSGERKERSLGLPWFTVGAYLDGWGEKDKLLGMGSGQSKKDAGNKAAEQALANKKLIKVYIERKRAFDTAQKAAMESSEL
jgi:ribonuclease III